MSLPRFHPAPLTLAVALALAAGAAHAQAQAAPPAEPQSITIAAQPLAQALNEWARQTGVELMVQPGQVAGRTAPAVSGQLTPQQALDRLLAGSGLTAQIQSGAAVVRPAAAGGVSTLPAVTVTGGLGMADDPLPAYAGGQVARGARVGLLGSQDFMDTPFSQTGFTSELIQNQQAQTLADVLANDPSVQDSGTRYGPTGSGMLVRGFANTSNLGSVTFNGMQAGSMYKQSAELYERVEITKGLDTMLNGMGPGGYLGGNINLVPKRAGDEPLASVTASYISNSQFGTHIDLGRRFGENKEWGIRANALYRDGETPWNDRDSRLGAGALGLDFRGSRLRASLDVLRQTTTIDNSQPVVIFGSEGVVKAPDPDSPILLGQVIKHEDTSVVLKGEYDISDKLSAFAGFGKSWFRGGNTGAAVVNVANADGDFIARTRALPYSFDNDNYQAGLRAAFATGPIRHRAVLRYDYVKQKTAIRQGNAGWGDWVEGNLYHAARAVPLSFDTRAPWEPEARIELSSLALADTLSFAEDRVLLTLGLRYQQVEDTYIPSDQRYDEHAVTPMFGVVVKPWTGVSLYANYIEGLQEGATVSDSTAPNFGEVFPPYRSKQYEVGAKWDFGRLATTLAAYQISQPSLTQDPDTLRYGVDGKQRNRGVEWTVFGKATDRLTLLGGVAYTQALLTRTAGGANDGNQAVGVSRVKANLGADWAVPGLPGFSLNGRVVYTGPAYLNVGNSQKLGSWTRVDVGARYATTVAGKPVTLRANVENLFDRGYWVGTTNGFAMLSAPRTVMLSATVEF